MKHLVGYFGSAADPKGFTLMELLVVLVIGLIFTSIAVVSLGTWKAQTLPVAGGVVADALLVDRQTAISSNAPVLVRFFEEGSYFTAFQSYQASGNGWVPSSKIIKLDGAVVIHPSATYSRLPVAATLGDGDASPSVPSNLQGAVQHVTEFEFLPDGSTNLDPSLEWCLTLVGAQPPPSAGTPLPANFVTVKIDPQTGRVSTYRP